MAEYGNAISLPKISHTTDKGSSEHSPSSFTTPSGGTIGVATRSSSLSKNRKPSPSAGYSTLGREPTNHQISSKKPRGRPPGSKNKPKQPTPVINHDNEQVLKPVVIEISAGSDVVEELVHFARRWHVGISVLSGSGSVSNVTLRHHLFHAPAFTLHGPFTMLSLFGTYISGPFPPLTAAAAAATSSSSSSSNPPSTITWPTCSSFGICLSGAQGQVFGGVVGGKVVAASQVVVVVSVFKNPEFHRVSINGNAEGEWDNPSASGGN